MKKRDEIHLAGLADGQLPAEEQLLWNERVHIDERLAGLLKEQEEIGELLRENRPEVTCPDTPEFFWAQISRRLESSEGKTREMTLIETLFRTLWAPAFSIGLAVVLFLVHAGQFSAPRFAVVEDLGVGVNGASATAFDSAEAGVTVIWLDGLDYIPANDTMAPDRT